METVWSDEQFDVPNLKIDARSSPLRAGSRRLNLKENYNNHSLQYMCIISS